jgi:hypothetical protein
MKLPTEGFDEENGTIKKLPRSIVLAGSSGIFRRYYHQFKGRKLGD